MDVQELAAKLKAINEVAVLSLDNESPNLWHEATTMKEALQNELDIINVELAIEWCNEFSRYVLKWN